MILDKNIIKVYKGLTHTRNNLLLTITRPSSMTVPSNSIVKYCLHNIVVMQCFCITPNRNHLECGGGFHHQGLIVWASSGDELIINETYKQPP